jgi:hypothetical protein
MSQTHTHTCVYCGQPIGGEAWEYSAGAPR